MKKKSGKPAEVKASLIRQLQGKGADLCVFTDMIDDYMKLWEIKEQLAEDIRARGVVYSDNSSVGVRMMKNNPSVKEIVGVNRQMLAILDKLNITTDAARTEEAGEDGL